MGQRAHTSRGDMHCTAGFAPRVRGAPDPGTLGAHGEWEFGHGGMQHEYEISVLCL